LKTLLPCIFIHPVASPYIQRMIITSSPHNLEKHNSRIVW
jgi:hypothetical protein